MCRHCKEHNIPPHGGPRHRHHGGGFMKGAIIGTAIGAILGFLYAPRSGKETREQLKKEADKMRDKIEPAIKDVKEKVIPMVEDAVEKARPYVEEAKIKAKPFVEDVKSKINEAIEDIDQKNNPKSKKNFFKLTKD